MRAGGRSDSLLFETDQTDQRITVFKLQMGWGGGQTSNVASTLPQPRCRLAPGPPSTMEARYSHLHCHLPSCIKREDKEYTPMNVFCLSSGKIPKNLKIVAASPWVRDTGGWCLCVRSCV